MRNFIYSVIIIIITISCSNPKKSKTEHFCFIRYDSLLNEIDTTIIEIEKFSPLDSVELRDKSVKKGEGSVFHFDTSGKLGVYAFMTDWPYTNFLIKFDSTGKKIRLQNNEVVQWRYNQLKADSILNITGLLCAVDRNYGDLVLTGGEFIDSNIQLYNSSFTKIIYFRSKIPINILSKSSFIYLKGTSQEKCTGHRSSFIDSMSVEDL